MDTTALENIGLSNAEIKVYLALLGLGSAKAGEVLKRSGLQNSVVHLTLAKLVEKGLASFVRRGSVRHYLASDPRTIVKFVEEKKQQLEQLLPALSAKQKKLERQEAQVFEGFAGFKAMLYEFIEDAERGDEYLFFSFYTPLEQDYQEVFKFYENFEQERLERGIVVKGVAPESVRGRMGKRKFENIVFVKFPTLQNLSIFRNRVIMTPWDERQISFLVTSSQLAENYRQYFYSIWRQFRKI